MTLRHLIIYAKRPLPGYAKTRLGAAIGDEQAAGVYARLLYTLLTDVAAADWPHTTIELSVAAPEDKGFFEAAFPEFIMRSQTEGDLGRRMAHSFNRAFDEGAEQVVLTGSDVPDLSSDILQAAFQALDTPSPQQQGHPGVIGPTDDGGYYVIGMRAPGADLFHGITWSTASVLTETEALAQRHGIALTRLKKLSDIDEGMGYQHWREQLLKRPQSINARGSTMDQ